VLGEYSDRPTGPACATSSCCGSGLLPRLARRYDPLSRLPVAVAQGRRRVETTYYPKRGESSIARPAARSSRDNAGEPVADGAALAGGDASAAPGTGGSNAARPAPSESATYAPVDTTLMGVVKHKRMDKSYGFIMVDGCGEFDGAEYFFHETDIVDGTRFAELAEGTYVDFQVKGESPAGKAPPARNVRRRVAV
jgi:cold shock CspA family protein